MASVAKGAQECATLHFRVPRQSSVCVQNKQQEAASSCSKPQYVPLLQSAAEHCTRLNAEQQLRGRTSLGLAVGSRGGGNVVQLM
jgi:hypothetical protein